jgi:hypothetical protein
MKNLLKLFLLAVVTLYFAASAELAFANFGGPDAAGYGWIDSKSPTPSIQYSWIEISGTGSSIANIHCDDCSDGPKSIGFDFNFYGTTYPQITPVGVDS